MDASRVVTGDDLEVADPDDLPLPGTAVDRQSLEQWVEYMRALIPAQLVGLTPAQCATRSVPASSLSLHGLIRHLAEVEHGWFVGVANGEKCSYPYSSAEAPEADFEDTNPDRLFDDLATFYTAVARSREIAAGISDLDAPLPGQWQGESVTLRWVLQHMIEEYGRHAGHADLLRECIDGTRAT